MEDNMGASNANDAHMQPEEDENPEGELNNDDLGTISSRLYEEYEV